MRPAPAPSWWRRDAIESRHASHEARGLAWQPGLFGAVEAVVPALAGRVERFRLDDTSWLDVVPSWLGGSDVLMAFLLEHLEWRQHRRTMFDQAVWEPRLSASARPSDLPAVARSMLRRLGEHYDERFDTVFCNLYRSGDDAVAWHSDRIGRAQMLPLVAIVSMGTTRTFALRPKGGGRAVRLRPAPGDLLVMCGRCQHDWEHCVPRSRNVSDPRLSFTTRPSRSL